MNAFDWKVPKVCFLMCPWSYVTVNIKCFVKMLVDSPVILVLHKDNKGLDTVTTGATLVHYVLGSILLSKYLPIDVP